jgi:uncharacterized protein (DUF2147 family)
MQHVKHRPCARLQVNTPPWLKGLGLGLMLSGLACSPTAAQAPTTKSPPASTPTAPASAAPPPSKPAVTGVWIDHTGRGAVEISPCGTQLCGTIVWMKDPLDKRGKPLMDGNNPDRAKRARPICGLQIIGDAVRQSGDVWDKGWIYNPDEGKSFDVEVRLKSADVLQVTGYLGVKFLSETFVWRRAPADQPRCAPGAPA